MTDILLWLEDQMEDERSAFVHLVAKSELSTKLCCRELDGEGEVMLFTSHFTAHLASILFPEKFTAVKPNLFVDFLLEMAQDNAHNILILESLNQNGLASNFGKSTTRGPKFLREEESSTDELELLIIESRIELVISQWDYTTSKTTYQRITERFGKSLMWIQMPCDGKAKGTPYHIDRWQELQLHFRLMRMAMVS